MRREYSVPERLGGFGLAVAAAAAVWPSFTAHTGLGLPCPLRLVTGVPCPGCGLTTAAVALVHGDPAASATAHPAVLGLAALTAVTVPLVLLRWWGVLAAPRPWPPARRRWATRVAVVLAAASWIYQMHRLGVG